MKQFFVLLALVPLASFAQSRQERLEERVMEQSSITRQALRENIHRMSEGDLRRANALLKNVEDIARGVSDPGPRPQPQPQPQPRPRPRQRQVCAQEDAGTFQSTFVRIREMAYSSTGLNYLNNDAIQFATEWTNNNPCFKADEYIQTITRLKMFAYSSTGLNYLASPATSFALEKEAIFCSHYPLETEFTRHYTFAYSATGLNMLATPARLYAMQQIEREAFSCNNR